MSWLFLSLLSALFLGIYDLCKKASVGNNAVAAVLLLSCLTGALIWVPFVLLSATDPAFAENEFLYVDPLSPSGHAYLFAKSALVGASWTFAFFALKHLPITVAMPIRASSPLWTILIACAFMGERPSAPQWLGVATILLSFFGFTFAGRLEGIHFHRDRSVGLMVCATLLAACSALYDKYLLQSLGFRAATVQAWFSIYLVPVMIPLTAWWYVYQRKETRFHWRWTIPLIACCLIIADYLYFSAIRTEGAMISLISPVRRVSVVVAFVGGGWLFAERNLVPKAICTATMLVGVWLLSR